KPDTGQERRQGVVARGLAHKPHRMLRQEGDSVCASRPLRLVSEAVQLVHVEVLTVALTVHNARRATRWSRSDSTGMPGDRRVRDKAWLPLWPVAGEQVDLVARLSAQVAHPDSAQE